MTGTEQFIASLVSSLAWPAVVVGVVLVFRRPLGDLVSTSLRRLKVGGFEIEFERVASSVQANLAVSGLSGTRAPKEQKVVPAAGGKPTGVLVEELAPLARTDPTGAVLAAYSRLEGELAELTKDLNVSPKPQGANALARLALSNDLISPQIEQAISGITTLRNLAVHARPTDMSVERALDYLALVDAVHFAIQSRNA